MTFRAAQLRNDKIIERLITQQEKAIIREYAKALRDIRQDLAIAYTKHATKEGLTYAEMTRYNRLANLENQIFGEVNQLTGKTAIKLKSGMGEVYQESYYRTAFTLEREVQARLGFGQLNPNTIKRAVENDLDKVGFLKRNRLNQDRLKAQLSSELTQGLIRGEAYQTVGKRIAQRMSTGATNAVRIARTEMHRCHMQGLKDSFAHSEEIGLDLQYMWVATVDGRTRDEHGEMDGKLTNENGMFEFPGIGEVEGPGMTGTTEDINCRCSYIAIAEGFKPEFRRVRGEGVVPYSTYNEWYGAKIA